jgi:hypothetical protein
VGLGSHAGVADVLAAGSGGLSSLIIKPPTGPAGLGAESSATVAVEVEPPSFDAKPPAAAVGLAATVEPAAAAVGLAAESPAVATAEPAVILKPSPAVESSAAPPPLEESPQTAGPALAPPGDQAVAVAPPAGDSPAEVSSPAVLIASPTSPAAPSAAEVPPAAASPTSPAAPPVAEVPPAETPPEGFETTLRLSEILPGAQHQGAALFGIQEGVTAQLSSEMLNSASRLRAPLDQPVAPTVPAWQQPMGAALTTGLSATSLTSALGNFQPVTDDLFLSRRVPSAADMAAAANAAQGGQAQVGDSGPRPPAPLVSPASGQSPALASGPGLGGDSLGAATLAPQPGLVSPRPAGSAETPADGAGPARPPTRGRRRGGFGFVVGVIAIIAGLGVLTVLLWYLISQWQQAPVPPDQPDVTASASATVTPSATPEPSAEPSATPEPSETAEPSSNRPAGSIPADTVKVCEDNRLGVMNLNHSCEVAVNVAQAIPADATGDFTVEAYAAPLEATVSFACVTQSTYYECRLYTGAIYLVAFGREGQ